MKNLTFASRGSVSSTQTERAGTRGDCNAHVALLSHSGHVAGELKQGNVVGEWLFGWMPGEPNMEILDWSYFKSLGWSTDWAKRSELYRHDTRRSGDD